MAIRINDGGITQRLEAIRISMGAGKADYKPRPPARRIEVDMEGKSVESLFHPSGLLIIDNRPVFAYIPDHFYKNFFDNPGELRRVHFAVCRTLQQMKSKGKWDKYRITNRDDDLYPIDTAGHPKRRNVRLYPCKNCLKKVRYKCFSYRHMSSQQQNEIVESFSAKEARDLLWQQFDIFKDLKSAQMPTGYAVNHKKISRAYRANKNFTCEKCGVNLKHKQECIDTHHISGVKNDNRYENLQCLCKLCHAKEHPHYRPSLECRQIIKQAREMQGITNRGH